MSAILGPLSALYRAAVTLRNRRFDRRGPGARAPLPVISVGNLTVGGTGKTPLVAWLATRLVLRGQRPAIVSRGYGGRAGRGPLLVGTKSRGLRSARECGDEPVLLARRLPDVPVVVGRDRLAGAIAAAEAGCSIVILDDGFQHRRLARDLDILLLDATDPFGGGRLLPAGRLREPLQGLARADLVLLTRSSRGADLAALERTVRLFNAHAPIVRADHRSVGFVDVHGAPALAPRRAVAFCGIGQPDLFRFDLAQEGVELLSFEARRDHHVWSPAELERLGTAAVALGVGLVTTEKDLARIPDPALLAGGTPILALRIEVDIPEPAPILTALERLIADRTRP